MPDAVHLRVLSADALDLPRGGWDARDVLDPYWRLYRNEDDGAFVTLADGAVFRFAAGASYFVPAGVRFSCGSDGPFRHFYLHFEAAGLPYLVTRALLSAPVRLPPGDDAWDAQAAALAAGVRRDGPGLDLAGVLRAKALLYAGLARYLTAALPAAADRLAADAAALEPVAPALAFAEAHLSEPLTAADLAARCCLSRDHFARRFRACLGRTPTAYVQERRVARAARLLLFTDDSLDAIAAACGFGSRFYLTRVFSRVMGVPPAAYRRTGPRA